MDQSQRGINDTVSSHAASRQETREPLTDAMDTSELKANIAQTRQDMDQTLETLTRQLHPRPLLLSVINAIWPETEAHIAGRKDAAEKAKALGQHVSTLARRSPVPFAIAGIGLAWLGFDMLRLYQNRAIRGGHAGSSRIDARTGEPYDELSYGAEYVGRLDDDLDDIGYEGGRLGESYVDATLGEPFGFDSDQSSPRRHKESLKQRAMEKAREVKAKVSREAREVKSKVSEEVREVKDRVGSRADHAADERRRLEKDYSTSA